MFMMLDELTMNGRRKTTTSFLTAFFLDVKEVKRLLFL